MCVCVIRRIESKRIFELTLLGRSCVSGCRQSIFSSRFICFSWIRYLVNLTESVLREGKRYSRRRGSEAYG